MPDRKNSIKRRATDKPVRRGTEILRIAGIHKNGSLPPDLLPEEDKTDFSAKDGCN